MTPAQTRRLLVLLLASGYCAVTYQTAWLRLLRLIFGASTAASAAVLATFMGGLGFGAWLFGRRADLGGKALELYASLEIGIAVLAAASPYLIDVVRGAYLALGGTQALGFWPGTALRLVLTALVLGPPAVLMGGTLPAAVRAGLSTDDHGRRTLGLMYGLNTLGAVFGAVVTTFVAIEFLGTRKTIWVAALLNLLLGVSARALARAAKATAAVAAMAPAEFEPAASERTPTGKTPVRLCLLAAAVSGFVFLLMELVWYRMLGPILGGSSYTFGLILAVALLGIGLGGLLYSLGDRARRPTLSGFAGSCALEALAIAAPYALGDRIAFLAFTLRPLGAAGFGGLALGWTVVTAAVVLPGAIIAGYQFPLLVGVVGRGRYRVGHEVGLTYAWNTFGAILGSLAGGFGLLPLLTAPGAWRLVVVLLAILAMLAAGYARRGARPTAARAPVLVAGLALALLLSEGPTAVWRHGAIGAGRADLAAPSTNELRGSFERIRSSLLFEAEGRESSVAVLAGDNGLAFYVNGKSDGSARSDAPTQVMGGLVGAALHPSPRSALVVGLGTGSTAGWLAAVPSIERVDVIELEPAIVDVARLFSPVNHECLTNPKVHIQIGDGREVLLTSRDRYDIIFSEPSNPYRAGISSLFTREFYQAASRALAPGGIFLQWLQGYDVDADVVRTAYATLHSVFPAVESWNTHASDLLLVATAEPRIHDLDRIRVRLDQEPFRTALEATWGVSGAEGLFSAYLASSALASEIGDRAQGRINTDDCPLIEFGFIRNLGQASLFQPDQVRLPAERNGWDRPQTTGAPLDWAETLDLRSARLAAFARTIAPPTHDQNSPAALRVRARIALSQDRPEEAARLWLSQSQEPRSHIDLVLLAYGLARAGEPRAPAVIDQLRPRWQADADAALALWRFYRGEAEAAVQPLQGAIAGWRTDPWAHLQLAGSALGLADELAAKNPAAARALYQSLEQPSAVWLLEGQRRFNRVLLANRVDPGGLCAAAFEAFEPHPPWIQGFLSQRASCYRAAAHALARTAEQDLASFEAKLPPVLWEADVPGEAPSSASSPP